LDNFNEIAGSPDLGKNYSVVTENLLGFKAGRTPHLLQKDCRQ